MFQNGEIEWSFCPIKEPTHMAAGVMSMKLGPTSIAVTHVCNIHCVSDSEFQREIIMGCCDL